MHHQDLENSPQLAKIKPFLQKKTSKNIFHILKSKLKWKLLSFSFVFYLIPSSRHSKIFMEMENLIKIYSFFRSDKKL
jgi:hypothetical protein